MVGFYIDGEDEVEPSQEWKSWDGSEKYPPEFESSPEASVDIVMRSGSALTAHVRNLRWNHTPTGDPGDIVSYRIHDASTSRISPLSTSTVYPVPPRPPLLGEKDGWVTWHGARTPASMEDIHGIRFRTGREVIRGDYLGLRWTHDGTSSDIVAVLMRKSKDIIYDVWNDWEPTPEKTFPDIPGNTLVVVKFRSGGVSSGSLVSRWYWKRGALQSDADIVSFIPLSKGWTTFVADLKDNRPIGAGAGKLVEVILRDGTKYTALAEHLSWHIVGEATIVAYRVLDEGKDVDASSDHSQRPVGEGWVAFTGSEDDSPPPELEGSPETRVDYVTRNGTIETNEPVEDISWNWDPPGSSGHEHDLLWWRRHVPKEGYSPPRPNGFDWVEWVGSTDEDETGPGDLDGDDGVEVVYRDGTKEISEKDDFTWRHEETSEDDGYSRDVVWYRETNPSTPWTEQKDDRTPKYPGEIEILLMDGSINIGMVNEFDWEKNGESWNISAWRPTAKDDELPEVKKLELSESKRIDAAECLTIYVNRYGKGALPREYRIICDLIETLGGKRPS